MRQWLSGIVAVLLLAPGLGMVALESASAGGCRWENVLVTDAIGGAVHYERKQVCPVGVTPASDPAVGDTSVPPPCDLASASPATFCWGSYPCYYKASVVPFEPPPPPAPTPGAQWHVRYCLQPVLMLDAITPTYTSWTPKAMWVGQANEPPPLVDQAGEAFGQLKVPKAKLVFNPTARTLVNLDTWFWAQDLSGDELRGSSAFGLVAVATPNELVITPGDGSAPFTCGWVTVKSDACAYAYRRSSVGGSLRGLSGAPAYEASGRATWTVRFEQDGVPVPIAGAPTELTGPELTAAVVVAEVQTLVIGAS